MAIPSLGSNFSGSSQLLAYYQQVMNSDNMKAKPNSGKDLVLVKEKSDNSEPDSFSVDIYV